MDKKLFTEYPEQDERQYYDRLVEQAKKRMDNLFQNQERALRDTHAKSHAAVKGTLEIFDIDEDAIKRELNQRASLSSSQLNGISLKQGLLAQPKQYPVWIRFANGRTKVEHDYVSDTRSMTVKVIGVEGERLTQSHESKTQDIITQNAEIFFIKTIRDYYGFFSAVVKSEKAALTWLLLHPKQFLALNKITKPIPKSLLTERYWSGSAYALGINPNFDASQTGLVPVEYPAVVKYVFTPVSPEPPHNRVPFQERPKNDRDRAKALAENGAQPDNYYRDELIQALAQPDAHYCWDFGIQFQTHPKMSIDDATIVWQEKESPFFTVGRLTVKHQVINFEKQYDFCENLRFSPWNGLTVHCPVGALNRLRSVVYPVVASYRHQKRGLVYQEPTGNENF
ncbi:MAG: catalase [Chlorogloeopsis fritschii C42_A2020_084]|uniref:catalase n=1 Tax=Chlorogloeopsis fritschii TaxID=1124 RepID=UPI0019D9CD97|nr:catalase [Chlorogloeopsis fritschii]MBF2004173.1 catalase [Chlorogloeopsis fritschii C42_A2020_084]